MLKITMRLSTLMLFSLLTLNLGAQDASPAKIYNEALGLMKESKLEEAFPKFEEAISLADTTKETDLKVIKLANRNGASCAYKLGSNARKAKDLEKAMEYFDKGIAMNPNYSGNYIGKAQVLGEAEDKTDAVKAYVEAGDVYAANSKTPEKAARYYKKAQTYSQLAYVKSKDNEAAVALADVYLEARPDAGDSYIASYYKAAALNKMEKNEDALTAIQAAVAALPEGEDADKYHLMHGLVNQALGNKDEAVKAYEMVKGEKYKGAAQSRINAIKQ